MTKNRTCEHSHCDRVLKPRQKRFCSHECKNKTLALGKRGGRPSFYKEHYATDDVWEYLRQCELNTTRKLTKKIGIITVTQPIMPSIEGYLVFLWKKYQVIVHRNTLRNWSKRHPNFDESMQMIKTVQGDYLINCGLSGNCNATMVTFLLKTNHGYGGQKEDEARNTTLVREVYELADKLDQASASSTMFHHSLPLAYTQTFIT